jgi:hypothetical protein
VNFERQVLSSVPRVWVQPPPTIRLKMSPSVISSTLSNRIKKHVKIQTPPHGHLHIINDIGEQNAFFKENFFNALLNRIAAKIGINVYWSVLTDPISAIFGAARQQAGLKEISWRSPARYCRSKIAMQATPRNTTVSRSETQFAPQ